jgi:hypothetical protein
MNEIYIGLYALSYREQVERFEQILFALGATKGNSRMAMRLLVLGAQARMRPAIKTGSRMREPGEEPPLITVGAKDFLPLR